MVRIKKPVFLDADWSHLALFWQTLAGLTMTTSVMSHIPVDKMTQLRFVAVPGIKIMWWIDDSRDWDEAPIDLLYIQTALEMMNLETH